MTARVITMQGRSTPRRQMRCGPQARKTVEAILPPGMTFEQLTARARTSPRIVHIMHRAMYELWKTGLYSTKEIARFLGRSDHTTVLWGVDRIRAQNGEPDSIARVAWADMRRGKAMHETARALGVTADFVDQCLWRWRAEVTASKAA